MANENVHHSESQHLFFVYPIVTKMMNKKMAHISIFVSEDDELNFPRNPPTTWPQGSMKGIWSGALGLRSAAENGFDQVCEIDA